MSKIMMLSVQLGAPQIMDDLLQKLSLQNHALAEEIKKMDTIELISECIQNAFETLKQHNVEITDYIADYYGNQSKFHNSMNIIGALKTKKLPNCLGVMLDKNGAIQFAADEYTNEWKLEIERLKKIFTDAFLSEAVKTTLIILGYQIEIETFGNETSPSFNITGVKQ